MTGLRVRLFGRFEVRCAEHFVPGLDPHKTQELFAYLLLHDGRPHSRESLANLMWPRSTTQQARKYLRHTLWQLQGALDSPCTTENGALLSVDQDWLTIDPQVEHWLDTAQFERAYLLVQGLSGREFDSRQSEIVRQALDLYRGDLLEGWYEDWCLFERERLQQLYLRLLEKRMIYCEAQGEYEHGLECGFRALRSDVARERIHRRMMRLHYLSGSRSGALRQYERCVAFLREELDVEPSARTVALYQQIRSDNSSPLTAAGATPDPPGIPRKMALPSPETLRRLEELQTALLAIQPQLRALIETFRGAVTQQD